MRLAATTLPVLALDKQFLTCASPITAGFVALDGVSIDLLDLVVLTFAGWELIAAARTTLNDDIDSYLNARTRLTED